MLSTEEIKQHFNEIQQYLAIVDDKLDPDPLITDNRVRLKGVLDIDQPTPEITDVMKEILRDTLGDKYIAKNPDHNPDNLRAEWSSDGPMFILGETTFSLAHTGTWSNAWSTFLADMEQIRGEGQY